MNQEHRSLCFLGVYSLKCPQSSPCPKKKVSQSSASFSHFSPWEREKKTTEELDESAVTQTGVFSQLTPCLGDGQWWEGVLSKSQECVKIPKLLLKVLLRIFWARCQCVEVKPWGWTWNSWRLHETWRNASVCLAIPLLAISPSPTVCFTSFCFTCLFSDLFTSVSLCSAPANNLYS